MKLDKEGIHFPIVVHLCALTPNDAEYPRHGPLGFHNVSQELLRPDVPERRQDMYS